MDNGVPIDSVGGSAQESVNLEDSEEHDAPPCPNRKVPPFASNSSQGSKIAPTPRSAACILSVCRHFGQRISRNRQAEAKAEVPAICAYSSTGADIVSVSAPYDTGPQPRRRMWSGSRSGPTDMLCTLVPGCAARETMSMRRSMSGGCEGAQHVHLLLTHSFGFLANKFSQ
ncbi:unnamed protein product [Sphagnum jensenii]|uniref:Uncharacterized protein n=1 Tax=Sphagnum jensenii TaxID=128206 RepID=A0ABP0X6Y5_9BRYO